MRIHQKHYEGTRPVTNRRGMRAEFTESAALPKCTWCGGQLVRFDYELVYCKECRTDYMVRCTEDHYFYTQMIGEPDWDRLDTILLGE